MSTYLRRTPALTDVVGVLQRTQPPIWGLRIAHLSGRPTGTVYPLLERLESEGLLRSEWESDSDRPGPRRRLYELTASGATWAVEWLAGKSKPAQRRSAGTLAMLALQPAWGW